jgi:adenylosuccinate synthase
MVEVTDKEEEKMGSTMAIASTQSGTGAALARKIKREYGAVAKNSLRMKNMPTNVSILAHRMKVDEQAYFFEVAQGFSLGINSEFYPHVTSRECTAMQAMADARIPPYLVRKTYMCIRTFPIRVGNLGEHSSGDWYEDQEETSWERLGVTPELTTVTKRVRRVATFSDRQFQEALLANAPDFVGINFLNYLPPMQQHEFVEGIKSFCGNIGIMPFRCVGGFGPKVEDWRPI